jgi:WD40 repeat protein
MEKQRLLVLCMAVFSWLISGCAIGLDGESNPLAGGDELFYLSADKIYRIVMPNVHNAELIYAAPEDRPTERFQLNALRCGPDDTLVFHETHTSTAVPSGDVRDRIRIRTYSRKTNGLDSLVDLGDTWTAFPALSQDKSKLAMVVDTALIAVDDLKSRKLKYYHQFEKGWVLPWSWDPDGKVLAVSGAYQMGEKPRLYFLDIESNVLTAWVAGTMPFFSPTGHLVAYASLDNSRLIVVDRTGRVIQTFGGHVFKELNGWVGDHKILFINAAGGYKNDVGVADLKTGKIYLINLPTNHEINGVCLIQGPRTQEKASGSSVRKGQLGLNY